MPIYEYVCAKCGAKFELLVSHFSKRVNCEKCGSSKVKKLMSGFSAGTRSCSISTGT